MLTYTERITLWNEVGSVTAVLENVLSWAHEWSSAKSSVNCRSIIGLIGKIERFLFEYPRWTYFHYFLLLL